MEVGGASEADIAIASCVSSSMFLKYINIIIVTDHAHKTARTNGRFRGKTWGTSAPFLKKFLFFYF